MTTPTDPRRDELADKVTRAPAWLRAELNRLYRDRDEWQRRATAGPEDSDTFRIGPSWYHGDADTPLGSRPRIRFVLADGSEIEAYLDRERKAVEVRATEDRMVILPQGNAITVRTVPR